MIPSVPAVLVDLAGKVMANAAPDVNPTDRAGTLGLSALLMGLAAEGLDSAAHHLVMENRAFRALLAKGAAYVPPPAEHAEDDFRLSALAAENGRLRAALILLQTAVEGRDEVMNDAIWSELRASTERRKTQGSAV
ncbi:hypothetical protein [Phenylobacterium sp.]|uniref:hypothetical protein n=1 Tax=Phenylobacterium sp. TaxID=1871053 RepID=UPI0030F3A013